MLVDLVARSLRLPAARRGLWRAWYHLLVRRDAGSDWTFMNYGFHGSEPLDLDPEEEPDRYCIQLYDLLASAAPLEGRDLLEVGSGRGGGAAWIHRRHGPRTTTGVDYTPANVAFCRRRHGAPGLEFVVGDAEDLPFEQGRFDAIVNLESSHCYGSRARFYREAARVLRDGGRFLHADLFEPAEAEQARSDLESAGLSVAAERDLTEGVVAAMERDDARKRRLVAERVPAWMQGLVGQFAGLEGSRVLESLRDGSLVYLFFDSST
jgi:SAM-dependent methyltransferase